MKKLVLFLFLIIGLSLAFPSSSLAECKPNTGVRCNLTNCTAGQVLYCCGSPAECTQLQNPDKGERDNPSTSNTSADIHSGCKDTEISTAIGCVPVLGGQQDFVNFILSWAIGIGGGIAFLLIVYAGFMIMTSSGNPERLKAGQELLTAAISGLILLIFSVFILNFIGVKILKIPGLQ